MEILDTMELITPVKATPGVAVNNILNYSPVYNYIILK
jgi:hypothetical protein